MTGAVSQAASSVATTPQEQQGSHAPDSRGQVASGREEARTAAAQQFLAGIAAQGFGIGETATPLGGDQLRAVGLGDQAAQMKRAVV